MPIQFQCPSCQASFTVPDEAAGKSGKCRKCGVKVAVPLSAKAPTVPQGPERSAPSPTQPHESAIAGQAPRPALAAKAVKLVRAVLRDPVGLTLTCVLGIPALLVVGLFLFYAIASASDSRADALWDSGKHAEAVALYKKSVADVREYSDNNPFGLEIKFSRIVEFEDAQGNYEAAQQYAAQGRKATHYALKSKKDIEVEEAIATRMGPFKREKAGIAEAMRSAIWECDFVSIDLLEEQGDTTIRLMVELTSRGKDSLWGSETADWQREAKVTETLIAFGRELTKKGVIQKDWPRKINVFFRPPIFKTLSQGNSVTVWAEKLPEVIK